MYSVVVKQLVEQPIRMLEVQCLNPIRDKPFSSFVCMLLSIPLEVFSLIENATILSYLLYSRIYALPR